MQAGGECNTRSNKRDADGKRLTLTVLGRGMQIRGDVYNFLRVQSSHGRAKEPYCLLRERRDQKSEQREVRGERDETPPPPETGGACDRGAGGRWSSDSCWWLQGAGWCARSTLAERPRLLCSSNKEREAACFNYATCAARCPCDVPSSPRSAQIAPPKRGGAARVLARFVMRGCDAERRRLAETGRQVRAL